VPANPFPSRSSVHRTTFPVPLMQAPQLAGTSVHRVLGERGPCADFRVCPAQARRGFSFLPPVDPIPSLFVGTDPLSARLPDSLVTPTIPLNMFVTLAIIGVFSPPSSHSSRVGPSLCARATPPVQSWRPPCISRFSSLSLPLPLMEQLVLRILLSNFHRSDPAHRFQNPSFDDHRIPFPRFGLGRPI